MRLSQLVANLQSTIDGVNDAEKLRDAANTKLLEGLKSLDKSLGVGGHLVVGNVMLKRPYQSLPVELSPITNLSPDTVVVEQ